MALHELAKVLPHELVQRLPTSHKVQGYGVSLWMNVRLGHAGVRPVGLLRLRARVRDAVLVVVGSDVAADVGGRSARVARCEVVLRGVSAR